MQRFTRNDDANIVMDNHTGLMWQDEDYTDEEKQNFSVNKSHGKVLDWNKAVEYANNLRLGGYNDWRLPTLSELSSIVVKGKGEVPAIDATFQNVVPICYWSFTTVANVPSRAWFVMFCYGHEGMYDKTFSFYVRCVRGNGKKVQSSNNGGQNGKS